MQSRLRICALRSARRSPEKATSQLMHKTNPPGLTPLLLRLAPIFGIPKHCDVGCEALSESAGAWRDAGRAAAGDDRRRASTRSGCPAARWVRSRRAPIRHPCRRVPARERLLWRARSPGRGKRPGPSLGRANASACEGGSGVVVEAFRPGLLQGGLADQVERAGATMHRIGHQSPVEAR